MLAERHRAKIQEIKAGGLTGDERQAKLTRENTMRHFTGASS